MSSLPFPVGTDTRQNPLLARAGGNLLLISGIASPGSGLGVGRNNVGDLVQVFFDRDYGKKCPNKRLIKDNPRLYVQMTEPSALAACQSDRRYSIMNEGGEHYVLGNGGQVDDVVRLLQNGNWRVDEVLDGYACKADRPRITAVCSLLEKNRFLLSLIEAPRAGNTQPTTHFWKYEDVDPGLGYLLHTHQGVDGLPTSPNEADYLPLLGDASKIAETYWDTLGKTAPWVFVVVKSTNMETGESTMRIHCNYS